LKKLERLQKEKWDETEKLPQKGFCK